MKKYAFTNGIILDGTSEMEPVEGKCIYVEDGRITGISDNTGSTEGYEVIDLQGRYIMPGLINLHVHLPGSGKPKKKQQDNVKLVRLLTSNALMKKILTSMCAKYAKTELMSGVTTIRTVGGVQDVDSTIRDDIRAGRRIGPRILAANMAVSVPGGHMAGSLGYMAESPEAAREYVRIIAQDKPDLIKLMITGGVLDAQVKGEPGVLKMSPEIVAATCDEAHKLGLKCAAHVESPEGVRVALENGVDSIEHGAAPDDDIIRLFKERKAFDVCTISPALPFSLFDRSVSNCSEMAQFNGDIVFQGILDCARACLANDIPVGLGTDTACPFTTHYDMWRELNYFRKYCEVSNAFALYTATLRNAELLGIDSETGSIAVGKSADMIVTSLNPLVDLQALRNVSMVISQGKLYKNPKVKKMAVVEEELDKYI